MSASVDRAERLRRSIGEFVRATRAGSDALPQSQAETLGLLDREGDATVARLARRRGIRHQSMRITVADLEAAGLVARRPDPDDARSSLVRITAEGLRVLGAERERRSASIAAAAERALDGDEAAELDRLTALLDRLTDELRR